MNIYDSVIEIQEILGSSYYNVGANFQSLQKEVHNSLSESETIINEFRNNLKQTSSDSLSSVVSILEEKVTSAQKSYKDYTDRFLTVMSQIFDSFEVLNDMHHPIERIMESGEQMELLALNAMVVAIQAGNQGGGFTCITDGFQKNAKTTFNLAGNLNTQRDLVSVQFDNLKKESEAILEIQKKISLNIKNSLQNDFNSLKRSINLSIDFIESIYNEAMQLKPAVSAVFEGLQNQDIIRQSMDHVLLALKEMDKLKSDQDSDEAVYMTKQFYDLSLYVLDEVIEQLQADCKAMTGNFNLIVKLLNTLEDKKETFLREQFDISASSTNLIKCLENISETFKGVISESESISEFENEIIKHKSKLFKSFSRLYDFISSFNDPLLLFHNTIILARIEIAKQPVIKNVETSINGIDSEIGIISDAIKEIEYIYDKFNILNNKIDLQLKKILNENDLFTRHFKTDITNLTDLSAQSGRIFKNLLRSMNFLNNSFSEIFRDINMNLELIDSSGKSLEKIRSGILYDLNEVEKSYSKINPEKLSVLMENKEIEKLLGKFTIFRHKEKILNNEISKQSVSDSSITLF